MFEELLTEFTVIELYFSAIMFGGMLWLGGLMAQLLGTMIFMFLVQAPYYIIYGSYIGIRCINKEYRENFMNKLKEKDDGYTE